MRAWCSRTISSALLTVGRQIAVVEMITGKAMVPEDDGAFKKREREARRPAHVDLVGNETDGSIE